MTYPKKVLLTVTETCWSIQTRDFCMHDFQEYHSTLGTERTFPTKCPSLLVFHFISRPPYCLAVNNKSNLQARGIRRPTCPNHSPSALTASPLHFPFPSRLSSRAPRQHSTDTRPGPSSPRPPVQDNSKQIEAQVPTLTASPQLCTPFDFGVR
jgi:hypothetical protein